MFWYRKKEVQAEPSKPALPTLRECIQAQFPKDYAIKVDDLVPNEFVIEHGWTNIARVWTVEEKGQVQGRFLPGETERRREAMLRRFALGISAYREARGEPPLNLDEWNYTRSVDSA